MTNHNKCRFCDEILTQSFINLGMSPLSNSYVLEENLNKAEQFYPLHSYICSNCKLVQLPVLEKPENIFTDYSYFSSYSKSWLVHAKNYVDIIIDKENLSSKSLIIEIASNDGYLLQYFIDKNIPVIGIEPAKNIAEIAIKKGIRTISEFFNETLAITLMKQNIKADVLVANNVIAHVPDIISFVKGINLILKDDGIATIEFPSILNIIKYNQFDTIYHEHFSYLSFTIIKIILENYGLKVFNAEELETHGGSLRVYACKKENDKRKIFKNVNILLENENKFGLNDIHTYYKFTEKVKHTKRKILELLISIKKENKKIIGYGAAAKGNTLLNYCSIREDFIDYIADISPHKQGKYLPGTHLPVLSPEVIKQTKPDYVCILPWNLKNEIINQLNFIKNWGGKFIIFIPEPEII